MAEFTPVKVSPEITARFAKLNQRERALNELVAKQTAETVRPLADMLGALMADADALWRDVKDQYGIDTKRLQLTFDAATDCIVQRDARRH